MQTQEAPLRGACLSPDGQSIYWCSYRDSEKLSSIRVYNLKSKKEKEIWRGEGYVGGFVPSPDGQWLAMDIGRGRGYDAPVGHLAIMPVSGGEIRKLVRVGLDALAWTPDSKQLLFAKFTAESGWGTSRDELWVIPMSGGTPKSLKLTSRGLWNLTIHPDGQKIAYTSANSEAEIWVMENFLPDEKAQTKY